MVEQPRQREVQGQRHKVGTSFPFEEQKDQHGWNLGNERDCRG